MKASDTDGMWRRWGASDPYFAVLSHPQYRSARVSDNREAFFMSGAAHVARVLRLFERNFGVLPRGRVLDFGCGVGRLLVPLAAEFDAVVGLDISPHMLAEAASNLRERSVDGVTLLPSDDGLSAIDGMTFDLVHSHIVLQHIRPARGMAMIERMLERISPRGGFYLHVSTNRLLSPPVELGYRIRQSVPYAYVLFNLLRLRAPLRPTMEMNEYDVAALLALFARHGFTDVVAVFERHEYAMTAGFLSRRS